MPADVAELLDEAEVAALKRPVQVVQYVQYVQYVLHDGVCR